MGLMQRLMGKMAVFSQGRGRKLPVGAVEGWKGGDSTMSWFSRTVSNCSWAEGKPERVAQTSSNTGSRGEICFNTLLLLFYFILSLRGGSLVNRGAIFVLVSIQMKPDTWAWKPLWSLWGTSVKETSQQLCCLTILSHLETPWLYLLHHVPQVTRSRGADETEQWGAEGEREQNM